MGASIDLTRFSFHDSGLMAVSHQGSTIVLTVEYFNEDDVESSVLATITGIETILRDDVPIQEFKMETPEGEIFRLHQENKEVLLIVFWDEYSPKSRMMREYRMLGSDVHLRAEQA